MKQNLVVHQQKRCKIRNSQEELKNHRNFPCEYCNRTFLGKYSLFRHQSTSCNGNGKNSKEDLKTFSCEFCNMRSSSKSYVRLHQERICPVKNSPEELDSFKKYTCEICNRKFRMRYCLNRHLSSHTNSKRMGPREEEVGEQYV